MTTRRFYVLCALVGLLLIIPIALVQGWRDRQAAPVTRLSALAQAHAASVQALDDTRSQTTQRITALERALRVASQNVSNCRHALPSGPFGAGWVEAGDFD